MSRFPQLPTALTEFAEDMSWHAMGIAQGALDLVLIATLALAVLATGLEHGIAGAVAQTSLGERVVTVHAPTVCVVGNVVLAGQDGACVTASVLQTADS